jgi:phytoene synthase
MPRRSSDQRTNPAADLAACRALLANGSRTFFAASFLLPRRVRVPASALYAFCRVADDAVDLDDDRVAALARLRERLALAYDGRPSSSPADRAFADVVQRFAIPRALPEALLEGFEWDVVGRHYDDLPQLHDYAARVAGTVGAMMAMLMGVRAPDVVGRACDLGIAMQLSNIARDVGEDARAGRLYLPRTWLAEAGIDADAWLAQPAYSPALGSVVRRLLRAADAIYARADAGIAVLPYDCRPGIRAARILYADIGHEVERRGLDSVGQRAVVPRRRKAALLASALVASGDAARAAHVPPLPAARYLVDAVVLASATSSPTAPRPTAPRPRRVPRPDADADDGGRVAWVIDLFERLERRDRLQRIGTAP